MRGDDHRTGGREHVVPAVHEMVDETLIALEQEFAALYPPTGATDPTAGDAVAGVLFDATADVKMKP